MTAYTFQVLKIDSYAQNLTEILSNPKITLRELKSVIGKLQFATSAIRPVRSFLRRLINKTTGIQKTSLLHPPFFSRARRYENLDSVSENFQRSCNIKTSFSSLFSKHKPLYRCFSRWI